MFGFDVVVYHVVVYHMSSPFIVRKKKNKRTKAQFHKARIVFSVCLHKLVFVRREIFELFYIAACLAYTSVLYSNLD